MVSNYMLYVVLSQLRDSCFKVYVGKEDDSDGSNVAVCKDLYVYTGLTGT